MQVSTRWCIPSPALCLHYQQGRKLVSKQTSLRGIKKRGRTANHLAALLQGKIQTEVSTLSGCTIQPLPLATQETRHTNVTLSSFRRSYLLQLYQRRSTPAWLKYPTSESNQGKLEGHAALFNPFIQFPTCRR